MAHTTTYTTVHGQTDEVARQPSRETIIAAQIFGAKSYDDATSSAVDTCRYEDESESRQRGHYHANLVKHRAEDRGMPAARHHACREVSMTDPGRIDRLPNEVLLHVLQFLDVSDLLATSRTSHLLRSLSLSPILQYYRLRRTRQILPPLLSSPARPTFADLMSRSIILSHTSVVSRRLARSLVSIRLSRRLAARPSAEALVERCVLPKECVPGMGTVHVAPALVAKRKAIEKEQVKDGLRRWIAAKWKGEVREREERLRRWHESRGIGRVWKLTRFWERVSRGDCVPSH